MINVNRCSCHQWRVAPTCNLERRGGGVFDKLVWLLCEALCPVAKSWTLECMSAWVVLSRQQRSERWQQRGAWRKGEKGDDCQTVSGSLDRTLFAP